MARIQQFYKGRRKGRNYLFIPFVVLLALISIIMVTFYSLQKYAVVTKDSVTIELPILKDKNVTIDAQGNEVPVFEPVDVELVMGQPDYSYLEPIAGKEVKPMRAIFVPYTDLNHEKLKEYAARLNDGNALLLEMKPRSGQLMWNSTAELAQAYGLSMATEQTNSMPGWIKELKDQDIYLGAQISCCLDSMLASRTNTVSIKTELGVPYQDDKGLWLDPYSAQLRDYIAQLCEELFALGFDEVVLADVAHPVLEEPKPLMYNGEISAQRSTVLGVCGFALDVARQLEDREGLLSIYCDTRPALVRPDESNGQDARMFMKLYDRVYIRTDTSAYPYNVSDIESAVSIGSVNDRLMPVVENYIPRDNSSWILIDVEEEDD